MIVGNTMDDISNFYFFVSLKQIWAKVFVETKILVLHFIYNVMYLSKGKADWLMLFYPVFLQKKYPQFLLGAIQKPRSQWGGGEEGPPQKELYNLLMSSLKP